MVFLVFHRYFRRFPVSFRQKHGFGPSFGLVRAEIFPASVAGKAKNVPVGFFSISRACRKPARILFYPVWWLPWRRFKAGSWLCAYLLLLTAASSIGSPAL